METIFESIDDRSRLIKRVERIEEKVDGIENKVGELLEQGAVTQENVEGLTGELRDQKDHFSYLKNIMKDELKYYRRVFAIGSVILMLILLWIVLRL
jgi:predicted nuclease with TOPRIM domain